MIHENFRILKCRYRTIVLAIFCGDIPTDHWHNGSLQEHQLERLINGKTNGFSRFRTGHGQSSPVPRAPSDSPVRSAGVGMRGPIIYSHTQMLHGAGILTYKTGRCLIFWGISVVKYSIHGAYRNIGYLHTYSLYAPGSSTCLSMTWGCCPWTNRPILDDPWADLHGWRVDGGIYQRRPGYAGCNFVMETIWGLVIWTLLKDMKVNWDYYC